MILCQCLGWKENSLAKLSQSTAAGGNLTDCWICHQIPWSIQGQFKPPVIPVTDFSDVPNVTTYSDQPPSGLTFQVQISNTLVYPSLV